MSRALYIDVGYMNDQYDYAELFSRLGIDYWTWFPQYLDRDGLLEVDKVEIVLGELEKRRHLLEEIKDEEEQACFRWLYGKFVRFVERERERDVSSDARVEGAR